MLVGDGGCQCVVIGNHKVLFVIVLFLFLEAEDAADCSEVISDMEVACGLNSCEENICFGLDLGVFSCQSESSYYHC